VRILLYGTCHREVPLGRGVDLVRTAMQRYEGGEDDSAPASRIYGITTVALWQSIVAGDDGLAVRSNCYYNLLCPPGTSPSGDATSSFTAWISREADAIWDNFTVTREDIRADYGEKRVVTFGILSGEVVVLVHTERDHEMHVISLRKAEKYEARYYFEVAQNFFRKGR
jgi:uncharacterized protein